MSQQLDTLRLLTTSMHNMADEVWAVQRGTPEDAYLHGALDAVFKALENACGAAEAEMRALARAKVKDPYAGKNPEWVKVEKACLPTIPRNDEPTA
jgi:hypothetical protein